MKVVFCSNYMSHHQLYFSQEMINIKEVEYFFIAFEPISKERIQCGWEDLNSKYPWIIEIYKSKSEYKKAKTLIQEADLVIVGSFPMKMIAKRIFSRKMTFLYSERWFKTSNGDVSPYINLHGFLSNLLHRKYLNFFNVYMLCASAYTAYDCSVYGNFQDKCFKWGYFPEMRQYDIEKLLEKKEKNTTIELLWVARMIQWKHPEVYIALAKKLKDAGIKFHANMIGDGLMFEEIKSEIDANGLEREISLIGSIPSSKVRDYMEKANIFIFTSDYNEGWGAVLNEAMNSGCAVVCNEGVGAAPFLIDHGKNGFIYKNGDIDNLSFLVRRLINEPKLRRKCGKSAYLTIVEEWNPVNAAKKIVQLYYALRTKNESLIPENGIVSHAPIIEYGITHK